MVEQLTRRLATVLGLLLLLWAASGVAAEHGAAAQSDPIVILLSLDGVRHDYLDRGGLPALERIARTGVRAKSLTPVFPSSTFPSHVALATGAHTDRHGIVGNRFHDPDKGDFDYSNDASFIEAEPIWVAAERQGVRSAAFFWVGSETDWNGTGASYRRTPFDAGVGEAEKVDQILAWLDLPAQERPRLILSWWHGADTAGHRFGPGSERTAASLRAQGRQLARLLEGLDQRRVWPHTTLLVVSDHGMIGVTEGIDAMAPLKRAGIRARAIPGAAYALIYLEDPTQREKAVAALSAVDGVRAYPAEAVPEPLRFRHPTRTGDVVALTDPPRTFTKPWSQSAGLLRISRLFGTTVGAHGYDPSAHPEMGGIFLALGRGVAAAAILPPVRAIDVAPTIASLLGIDPPTHAEGHPIPGIGSGPRPFRLPRG
jgi:arylsulfatase A-like enzyme